MGGVGDGVCDREVDSMTLTCGSLFSGIGGLDLAAEWAGLEIAWQCEIDEFCRKVLKKHWPGVKQYDDIREINKEYTERTDILVGGWPCQPYSIAGDRKGEEDDRALWGEFFRVTQELRPNWIVGENVANFANMALDDTLFDLEGIGYTCQAFIIPALAINAPHRRDRIFIVAYLPDTCSIGYKRAERLRKNIGEIEKRRTGAPGATPKLFDDIDWQERARESGFCGTDDGISNRMDRIRALGNAVNPYQAYPIFQAIVDIEKGAIA